MFGRRKRPVDPDAQIPYEVYQTVQEPAIRRRQWIVRLFAALIVVTLLIFGSLWLSRTILNRGGSNGGGQKQSQDGSKPSKSNGDVQAPDNLKQATDNNPGLPNTSGKPQTAPQSGENNTSTVRKPE